MKRILENKSDAQQLYISAQATYHNLPTKTPFDLQQEIIQFFNSNVEQEIKLEDEKRAPYLSSHKLLLLQGNAGSGKSVFCQDLSTHLWQNYREGDPIPLFISLPQCEDPIEQVIEETLENYGFTEEQITTLKKEYQFNFILDGYDELHQFKNLYVSNRLQDWRAQTIITCRSQALYRINDYEKFFIPFINDKRQSQFFNLNYQFLIL